MSQPLTISLTKIYGLKLSPPTVRLIERGQRERQRLNDELADDIDRMAARYLRKTNGA